MPFLLPHVNTLDFSPLLGGFCKAMVAMDIGIAEHSGTSV